MLLTHVCIAAITSCVSRITPRITSWPKVFRHVGAVKTFIATAYPDMSEMTFEGVENRVFQGYVLFHTARVAWEGRMYEMQNVPTSWNRGSIPNVPKTLTSKSSPVLLFAALCSRRGKILSNSTSAP
jgi:hypothetical protein